MEVTHEQGIINIEEHTVKVGDKVYDISSGSDVLLESGVLKDGQTVSIITKNSGVCYQDMHEDYCQLVCPICGNHF